MGIVTAFSRSARNHGNTRLVPDQVCLRQPGSTQRLGRHKGQADMRLVLYISAYVAGDVGARRSAQPRQVAAEVIQAGRGPPEADDVRVLREFFARIQVVSL